MIHNYDEEAVSAAGDLDPIHTIKPTRGESKSEPYLKWARDAYDMGMRVNEARGQLALQNLLLYQGVHGGSGGFGGFHRINDLSTIEGRVALPDYHELVINELYDTVQQITNKLAQLPLSTRAVPHSGEHSDKEGAEAVRDILDTIKYQNNLQRMLRNLVRDSIIFGESFIMPNWNKHKGDMHPAWLKLKSSGKKKGTYKVRGFGEIKFDPSRPIRIGDVCFRSPLPWELIIDFKKAPEEVQWTLCPEWVHVEELKYDYPSKANDIKAASSAHSFDIDTLCSRELKDHTLVFNVFGRRTRFLPDGLFYRCTPDVMLEEVQDSPYPRQEGSEWGDMPLERLTDIDIPGRLHAASTFQVLGPLQHTVNQLWTMMRKNALAGLHYKILEPRQGKVNYLDLGNDSTRVPYTAPFKPEVLFTGAALPKELFAFIETIGAKITQMQGLQPISKGQYPSNIRSGKQISMIQELEAVRSGDRANKRNELLVAIDKKVLAIIGEYYKDSDHRLINIMGRNKQYIIDSFKASVLNKPYDVRIEPQSPFPELPSQRMEMVSQLFQTPGIRELLPAEQWVEILQLGAAEKFYNITSVAASKAEWENEQYVQGKIPPLPDEGDDNIVHWRVHMTTIRSQSFLGFREAIQKEIKKHVMVHEERLMTQLAETNNPLLAQKVAMLTGFPSFMPQPPASAQAAPQQIQPVNGAANEGDVVGAGGDQLS